MKKSKPTRETRVSTFQWVQEAKSPQTKLLEIVERLEDHAILTTSEKEKEHEPPVNICVFDGGAMRTLATLAMYDEISKRFQDKQLSDYFDLVGGTSAVVSTL